MSLFSYNPPNQLTDDVLLVIFDQLDEDDFLRCEVVCRRWRNFLLSQTPWRRLFHRKIVSSEKWRQLWRSFGVDKTKLPSGHYRGLCRALIRVMNETDRNWRNGNFQTTLYSYDFSSYSNVTIGNDCIACHSAFYFGWDDEETLKFFDQCSPEVKSRVRIPRGSSAVTNAEIVVLWDEKDMKILDTDGQLICEVPELDEYERISWDLTTCCIAGDQVAVISRNKEEGEEKLSLWDVRNLPKVIFLKSRLFNLNLQLNCFSSMKMDDQFIAIQDKSTNINFFSKETLGLQWQKTLDGSINGRDFVYGKGLLLLFKTLVFKKKMRKSRTIQRIEMYDVTSGHCIRELPYTVGDGLCDFVCFNSKFMVVAPFKCVPKKKLFVYDLEAIKNPNSDLLARTIVVNNDFHSIMVSETEIFYIAKGDICRLNFSPFGLFGNAAKTRTLSSPWRSVWRRKGVDEEPLEPVHHMEVYMEVIQYFDELSANCQTAIETCPASDLMADDVTFYIENMNRISPEKYSKTALISNTTHASLFGKTIQLIESSTDRVVTEMTLTSDAISLHFGHNLLVVVSQNTNIEHVLGIWRVDHSLNLTHLRDVSIEEYNGTLQIDEHFIAVETVKQVWTEKTYNFISMKTFQVERSVSSRSKYLRYDGGYLFALKEDDLVGILDVASGTFLRDITITPFKYSIAITRANSNYVVMGNIDSKLYVYDLKCLKETDAVPSNVLLTTIGLKCKIEAMMISDTRIVCLCQNDAHVVDLKPVDRLRCPESC